MTMASLADRRRWRRSRGASFGRVCWVSCPVALGLARPPCRRARPALDLHDHPPRPDSEPFAIMPNHPLDLALMRCTVALLSAPTRTRRTGLSAGWRLRDTQRLLGFAASSRRGRSWPSSGSPLRPETSARAVLSVRGSAWTTA